MKRIFLIVTLAFLALITPRSVAAEPRPDRGQTTQVDTSGLDLKQFALSISRGATTDYERAERMLNWLSHNFKWLATDYRQRTVKEIIGRQGGNCFELATVYMALVKSVGIKYRQIAEINIQPVSERRQKNAEDLVAKRGFSASVFGAGHNDHRWVEIYDEKSGEWIPADPAVGVIGLAPWLKSRVWFGKRWAIDTSITNDMIVPIAIFTTDSTHKMIEDRSAHYLITSFNRLYNNRLSALPEWSDWVKQLRAIGEKCRGAFEGKVNLHTYRSSIGQIARTFSRLRDEFVLLNVRN
jgi:hypothetical protein